MEAKKFATGGYEVHFNRDVSGCAYEATLGHSAINEVPLPEGIISVAPDEDESLHPMPEWVLVNTWKKPGEPANLPFHLAVFC